jgi:hypothetical protein
VATLALITGFREKFDRQIAHYSDERVVSSPRAAPGGATANYAAHKSNIAAKAGRRLKENCLMMLFYRILFVGLLCAAVFGVYLLIHQAVEGDNDSNAVLFRVLAAMLSALVIATVIGFVRILLSRQGIRRRRK